MNKLVGVLIEPRKVIQIYHNILNFQKCLPNILLYLFIGKNTKSFHIENIKKYNINLNNIIIKELDINNLDFATYSNLLKSKDFWENLNGEYVLTIQTDGCLCYKTTHKIEDFFKYDYIGGYAPQKWWWKETQGLHDYKDYQCFNGGFSLRNRKACLDVINNFPSNDTKSFKKGIDFKLHPEDLYFVVCMFKLKYNVAKDKFSTNFCSHTCFTENSFCIHKINHYVKNQELIKCINYCNDFKNFIKLNLL